MVISGIYMKIAWNRISFDFRSSTLFEFVAPYWKWDSEQFRCCCLVNHSLENWNWNVRNFFSQTFFFCALSINWHENVYMEANLRTHSMNISHSIYYSYWLFRDSVESEEQKMWTILLRSFLFSLELLRYVICIHIQCRISLSTSFKYDPCAQFQILSILN